MKKLFAILLSVLMLCSMIPFAAVSAAGDYYIELVADADVVDAGGELAVEVSLYGHESIGLTGAQIELGFDPDVFELTTYYDEDEEMYMPPIEVATKFNASSNKYILFSPIDEETGYMERCLVQFQRATASATQAVKTNLFYTVTFTVKDDAPSGDYTIQVINHNDKNIIMHGPKTDVWSMEPITVTVNGSEPAGCEHDWVDATCTAPKTCSLCGETEGTALGHDWADATCTAPKTCSKCGATEGTALGHTYNETARVEASCEVDGSITYTCACGDVKTEVIPAGHKFVSDYDYHCADCGYVRELVMSADKIVTFAGKSAKEFNAEKGEGALAFKFDMAVMGIQSKGGNYYVNYDNATINIDGTEYKLVDIGAIVNNVNKADATLADANDGSIKKVAADKAFERKGVYAFAIRITNVPVATHGDTVITARSYYTYEDAEGSQFTVYGDDVVATYNNIAG